MKKVLPVVALITSTFCYSQSVQWASKVIEFSSELTSLQYSASQTLGKPNVLPAGGQNPSAWTPDKPKHAEYIKLGYDNPMQIQQVAIAESYNPGALINVYVYDESGEQHLVGTFTPQPLNIIAQMRTVFFEKTTYKVNAVKLEFDGKALPDYFSIDAVAISDSRYPIIADIAKPELLKKGLIIEALDKNVNSESNDYNALLSPDGKILYFSRQNHPENTGGIKDKEDIWYSELDADGKWTLAKNAGTDLNNSYPNFVSSVSSTTPDGKAAVLLLGNKYNDNGTMSAGVSVSKNVNGKWTKPKSLNIKNDYNYSDRAHYFLSNSQKILLMSVDREDTKGGRDLYVSFEQTDSTWSEPLNLGKNINTAADELSPFLCDDGKTLYFSSNGYSGYGGSDIFVSTRLDSTWTNWSEAKNMGGEINSKTDDQFFNIPSVGEYAYFSRVVTPGNADIYRVKMPFYNNPPEPIIIVKGKLVDEKTGKPIAAKITFSRIPDGKEAVTVHSNPQTGEYEAHLPGGYQYDMKVEAENYVADNEKLDLTKNKQPGTIYDNIKLKPTAESIAANSPEDIKESVTVSSSVFFDFDKAELKKESFTELDHIISLMNEKSKLHLYIAGHTDQTGPENYNMALSERRAKAVSKYILGKGISADRIVIEFFGETKPVDTSNTKEGNAKNRRVEFKIIKLL